ncbi:acyl-CoA dehydrogenase family protein [Gordonia soli]|uniref:Putative acyl-CoA dehydrogenase n=1 Tax=Gordonia soli NBRC 108243 TaxID=1223545 RepID=M0QRS6_9ACTN|nr:acyl-CoA dehydrogenase family protein [Gordonia soli]GAC70317.1 putative acyl-CoA dehydrogenase [Gordonia soli NBRC 108243]
MEFALSTEQVELAAAERGWLQKNDPIVERRESIDDTPARMCAAAREHVVESGLAGLLTTDLGGTNVDLLVVVEEHGRAGSAIPIAEWALAARLLEGVGSPHHVEVAEGRRLAVPIRPAGTESFEVTELANGSLRVRGTSTPTTGLADAECLVLSAIADDGRVLIAEIPTDDVDVRVLDTLDLLRSWSIVHIDVTVDPGGWSVAIPGTDALLADQLAVFRSVDALGAADRLLHLSVEHARQREQFGRPIGSFQAVKHHLANMSLAVEASRAVLWAAAVALDDDGHGTSNRTPGRGRAVSSAIAYAGTATAAVAQLALQVHGGIGFTWEHDVHLLIRRIKVDELLDGSVGTHRDVLVGLHESA